MKRAALPFAAGCLAAAGFGGGWLTARKSLPSAEVAEFFAPSSGAPEKAPQIVTPEAALTEGPRLQGQIGILLHIAGLPLAEVQAKAKNTDFRENTIQSHENATLLQAALCTRWAELDAEGLLAAAQKSNHSGFRDSGIKSAFKILAKTDAKAAWRRANGLDPGSSQRMTAQRDVLNVLVQQDAELAFSLVKAGVGAESLLLYDVIQFWAADDPEAAAAAVLTIGNTHTKMMAVMALVGVWAAKDYAAATSWAEKLGGAFRRKGLASALRIATIRNPAEALRILETTELGMNRQGLIEDAIRRLAAADFDSAVVAATSFKSFKDKSIALAALEQTVSGTNRARVLKLAEGLPPKLAVPIYQSNGWHQSEENLTQFLEFLDKVPDPALRDRLLPRAVASLSTFNPAESGRRFMELPGKARTPDAARKIANGMARKDSAGALRWVEGLEEENLVDDAMNGVLDCLENTDPEAATREILKFSDPQRRAQRIHSLAVRMTIGDAEEANRWAARLTGRERLLALGAVTLGTVETSRERARELYQKYGASLSPEDSEGTDFPEAVRRISAGWAREEPTKAAAWALSLPEGKSKELAIEGLISSWAYDESVAASEWVNSLPPGGIRNIAEAELARRIADSGSR